MRFEKISSIIIIMMYLLSPAYAFELFGHEVDVDVDWSDPASVAVGAVVGAGIAAVALGTGVGEIAIGAAVFGIAAEGVNRIFFHNNDDSAAVATGGKTPTKEELLNDTDVTSTFGDVSILILMDFSFKQK